MKKSMAKNRRIRRLDGLITERHEGNGLAGSTRALESRANSGGGSRFLDRLSSDDPGEKFVTDRIIGGLSELAIERHEGHGLSRSTRALDSRTNAVGSGEHSERLEFGFGFGVKVACGVLKHWVVVRKKAIY